MADLYNNCRCYYELEDSSGTDATGNGNTLTETGSGITHPACKVSNGIDFTYATDANARATCASNSFNNLTGAFTLAGWVLFDTITGNTQCVFGKSTFSGTNHQYGVYRSSGGSALRGFVSADGSSTTNIDASFGDPTVDVAYFVVLRFTGSQLKFDVWNSSWGVSTPISASAPSSQTGAPFHIGAANGSDSLGHDGWMDQVGLWNYSIDDTERDFLLNSGSGRTWASIVATYGAPAVSTSDAKLIIRGA